METTAEVLAAEDARPLRLDPGAWWGVVVAAVLVLAFMVGPILVLALGDHLDHEVPPVSVGVDELTEAPALVRGDAAGPVGRSVAALPSR